MSSEAGFDLVEFEQSQDNHSFVLRFESISILRKDFSSGIKTLTNLAYQKVPRTLELEGT